MSDEGKPGRRVGVGRQTEEECQEASYRLPSRNKTEELFLIVTKVTQGLEVFLVKGPLTINELSPNSSEDFCGYCGDLLSSSA